MVKLDSADFEFVERSGEQLAKTQGQINGIQFTLHKLANCGVQLLDHCGPVTADGCTDCVFEIGPVEGSFFMRNCSNCTVSVACQQFRARDLKK